MPPQAFNRSGAFVAVGRGGFLVQLASLRRLTRGLAVTRGPSLVSLTAALALVPAVLDAAAPRRETMAAWTEYLRSTEARIARELTSPGGFLALDFGPAREADRRALLAGQLRITRVVPADAAGGAIDVPGGAVHHWRGGVFVPGARLDPMLARLADPRPEDLAQDDVVLARVLERAPGSLRIFLRLQRSQIVTVVYDTEHLVRFTRHGDRRASSRSTATRIAELADPATPAERERPFGQDRGFLRGLNAYWRYEQVGGGVIVECESVSLSRAVPALVRAAVGPFIDRVASGSMERTLLATRARFARVSARGE